MWVNWTVLSLCAISGLVAGFFLVKFLKFGIALTGGTAGAALAFLILNLVRLDKNQLLYWSIVIGVAAIATFLTFKKSDEFMIFSTAMIGSYLLIRGTSLYTGGYPNEFMIAQEV